MGSITTPVWTENQTLTAFDDNSPANNVTAKTTLDIAALGFDLVKLQLKITWDVSATGYALLNIYSSSDSGTTKDTIPIWSQRITPVAGTTTYITLNIQDEAFVDIWLENKTGQEMAEVSGKYAGRKWNTEESV